MTSNLTALTECEIVTTRIFQADIEKLFEAWTNPDLLQQWWGPAGFTNTFHEFDLRPGGRWRFTMHGPEKGHYENEVEFLKIERPTLLAWNRISKPLFRVVTSFEKMADNQTKVIFRMQFDSEEACNKLKQYVPDKNEENFDKLENLLYNSFD